MPLKSGKSNIGNNISELEGTGRPYAQALAIALKTAGVKPARATGGHVGALKGATGGRADALPVDVPDGAYVIPADVVSALGDGNTQAGFEHLNRMFPATASRAAGGKASPVKCKLSDGEFVVPPDQVQAHGGYDTFDKWIMHVRQMDIKRRQNLPGPVKE